MIFKVTVLRANAYARSFKSLDKSFEMDERSAYGCLDFCILIKIFKLCRKILCFGSGHVHLPVACNKWFSHFNYFLF